ncbi:MAG: NADPH-dependent FMN reductase [Promethearchaeota archaeon]|nr:MAG: NADPH-dependent FMN reductase [Candidatus Lokiarchaeota archaeon]
MKKICLIVGSPRKSRSCNFLIDKAIEGIKSISEEIEINKIYISDFEITPCNGCDACLRDPFECPLSEHDDTKKLEEFILNTDGLLIASPSYFGSVSAQIKTVIDRSRPWKMNSYRLKNVLFAPMVAIGTRNDAAGGVISDLINFALIHGMVIIGALGNPVLDQNIPITSLQKYNRKEFLKKEEIDELGGLIANNLGKRVAELVLTFKK